MQTTLLGLAIALILALLAALVGPYFIDWNTYRPRFEAEASRLVGLPVRVGGAIDVRILPTPTLLLNGVEIGAARRRCPARAFARHRIRAAVRWCADNCAPRRRASPARNSPSSSNADGRASLPSGGLGFDAGDLVVDHLHVEDARVSLVHAREQPALCPRQALVRRRSALARRLVPRRGRVRLRQGSLRLPHQCRAAGMRADPPALQSRSVRARAQRRRRGHDHDRERRAEIRGQPHLRASGRYCAGERPRGGQRAAGG